MAVVVETSEFRPPRINTGGSPGALSHLVSRMYTDAVFNQDIRVIQTIVSRIDGGLPKDTEVDGYQTLFGDCLNAILGLTDGRQLVVTPEDTVMMALCKSLYDIAATDIYHEIKTDSHGNTWHKKVNPSTEKKQARDSAWRLILERVGGRKTATPKAKETLANVEVADWITASLPQGGTTERTTDGERDEALPQDGPAADEAVCAG